MDKIEKHLNKLSNKEKEVLKDILDKLKKGELHNLDIKKLKGRDDIFRVRKGKIRIIYRKNNSGFFILAIERRNNNTYNKF